MQPARMQLGQMADRASTSFCRRAAALNRRTASARLSSDDEGVSVGSRRAGRRAGEYAHINQDMLKVDGYFDMPIQVTLTAKHDIRRLQPDTF